MSEYTKHWECCGDTTITESWVPDECPFCENVKLKRENNLLDGLLVKYNLSINTASDKSLGAWVCGKITKFDENGYPENIVSWHADTPEEAIFKAVCAIAGASDE